MSCPQGRGAISSEAVPLARTITGQELTFELSGDNIPSCGKINVLFLKGYPREPLYIFHCVLLRRQEEFVFNSFYQALGYLNDITHNRQDVSVEEYKTYVLSFSFSFTIF